MKRHTARRLEDELAALAQGTDRPVTLYLIGGGSMALRDIKDATKDVDVVLESDQDLRILVRALQACGYGELTDPGTPYQKMGVRRVYGRIDAPQWDLFVGVVCGKMALSPGMRSRATPWGDRAASLDVRLVSLEDVFVFKSITDREADRDDQEALFATGLDWTVILDEMRWQVQNASMPWTREFLAAMDDLRQRGNPVPIMAELEALDDEVMAEWADLHVLGSSLMIRSEIVEACWEDDTHGRKLVEQALDRLTQRGVVRLVDGRYSANERSGRTR